MLNRKAEAGLKAFPHRALALVSPSGESLPEWMRWKL